MRIVIKDWIYKEAQVKANKYNFTLVWSANEDIFSLYGNIEKETEKAILFSADYWNLNKAVRCVTDAPRCGGFKIWIPKTAIIKTVQKSK